MKISNFGFTLTELLIVIAIVAILSAIGFPAYNEQMQKGRRADAKNMILQLASLQERYHSNFGYYGSLNDLTGTGTTLDSDSGHYEMTIACIPTAACTAASRSQRYTSTATVNATDGNCGNYTYTQAGNINVTGSKGVEYCW